MFSRRLTFALCVVTFLSLASHARAQLGTFAAPGTVSGMGSARVERPPSLVRMTIQLSEQGESLQAALGKLKDRQEAAVLQLESLKATNVQATGPRLAEKPAQARQMERMVMQQLRAQGRRVPKGLEVPESVTVAATLTAEWPLTFETGEELLLVAKSLEERVEKADLAGVNEPKELTPEQRELAEEMQAAMSDYSYGEEPQQPGKPQFLYVARVSDEDQARAFAEAFAKAKAQAARLARAAAAQLGPLSSLSGSSSPATGDFDEYDAYARMVMVRQAQQAVGGAGEDEAVSPQAGNVRLDVTVVAGFQLSP